MKRQEANFNLLNSVPRNQLKRPRGTLPWLVVPLAIALLSALWSYRVQSPVLASEPADAAAVAEAIERLPVVGSVLLTGAHPDDENSTLLPYLARSLHLRTAYLSATRGDGGQNLLGTEQYEALGILRTEELLAARRLDGAEQFFGQAYDFGFSKSAEETLAKWGREQALGDFVRIIRAFRPDIVISRFTGTGSDGHGHHQAAGMLTRDAFRAAADSRRFPEQIQQGLRLWQATRLFLNSRDTGSDSLTLTLDGFSPLYGKTYPEMGLEARSMHRSQGMGAGGGRGGAYVTAFRLVDSAPSASASPKGVFDGIDLTLNRFTALAGGSQEVARRVEAIFKAIDAARQFLSPGQPSRALPALAEGLNRLREVRTQIQQSSASEESKDQALFWLACKESDFVRAIGLAGGLRVEAVADKGEIVPGESFAVTVSGLIRASEHLQPADVSLTGPAGWKIEKLNPAATPASKPERMDARFKVTVPADAPVSQPYWLQQQRTQDYFPMPQASWIGEAQNPAILKGHFQFIATSAGKQLPLEQQAEVIYRFADRVYGERERPLTVVPLLGVWVEPEVAIFPAGAPAKQTLLVRIRSNRTDAQQGTIHLDLPSGWKSSPATNPFALEERGDEAAARFEVFAPGSGSLSQPERHPVKAVAEVNGQFYSTGYQVVDYPHTQARYWFRPAVSNLLRFDVKVAPGLRVGYVMGSGDNVADALKQLGLTVEQLGPDELAFGNLSRFDAIVTGIRAYEVRKDLFANHNRLMDYVQNGGLMIVQYSRVGGVSEPLGPYPMDQNRDAPRVAVEEAPVEILEASSPVFRSPNLITGKDFEGWVQERGTYFMSSWAPEYRPLLSSNDPGEPPQKGGMLLASYGKGLYLYTGYAFFRQLPAGVPGAYRLFANLISLGKTAQRRP